MILTIICWILLTSAITLFGAWYAKKYNRADALVALYVAFIMFSNIAASKISTFDFGFATFFVPAAVIIFAVTFLLTDIVNEKFGRIETHRMIFIAFVTQVALSLFIWITLSLSPAPFWQGQAAFEAVFGQVPRIIIASWIAFLVSENTDAWIFAYFKKLTNGKKLWLRNVVSTLPSMFLDSVIFVTIAFYGVIPIVPIILGQIVMKWLIGVIDIPFMYLSRAIMK